MGTLDTEYVYLEMIRDEGGQNYDVVAGLLQGLHDKDGDLYVLLGGLKGCTECLLVGDDGYDFLSIEVLEKDFRNMSYCKKERHDQEQALKIVQDLYKDLKENGYEDKPHSGLIDIKKYVNVPEEYMDGKPLDATKTTKGTYNNHRNHYSPTATGTTYTKTQPKPDPEPASFSRTKTGKPTADDLTALSELLDQLAAGEVTLELPETPEDDVEETSTSAAAISEKEMDDYYGTGGW